MRYATAAWAAMTLLAAGCGNSSETPASATKPQRAPAIRVQSVSSALSDREVAAFLKLVPALPGGAAPEFGAATISESSEQLSGVELATRWKREFRSAYQAETQARLWREQRRLIDSLGDAGVEPQALASLLVRLSTAVARDALDPRIDLASERQKADRQVASLCERIDRLPTAGEVPDSRQTELTGTRRALTEELREAVAFREFVLLLEQVPEESLAVIREHRSQLKKHLPAGDAAQAFERRIENGEAVLPVSHEAPAAER